MLVHFAANATVFSLFILNAGLKDLITVGYFHHG